MNNSNQPRTQTCLAPPTILVALAVSIATIAGDFGYQSLAPPFLVATAARAQSMPGPPLAEAQQADDLQQSRPPRDLPPIAIAQSPGGHERAPRAAAGALPDGITVFDDAYPGITNLDPGLLLALHEGAMDAADDGVKVYVTSGWRAPEYQEQLLREAVAEYGSLEEAARWVATPNTSAHVSGNAVDLGPADATVWLAENSAGYGLCQIYGNEPWHYELRPEAANDGCPPMYADPTHDPGMRP